MLIETIKPRSELYLNMLLYALTGAGKTHFLGTAQRCELTSPILIMDVGGGMSTLAGSGIKTVRPRSFADIQEVYDFMRYDNVKYRSIGIDGVTGVQRQLSMAEILDDMDDEDGYKSLAKAVPPNRHDWLQSFFQMAKFICAFKDLAYLEEKERRVHVFFTALEKTDSNLPVVCPGLSGMLGLGCGSYVDILARLTKETVVDEEDQPYEVRRLLLEDWMDEDTGLKYLAKTRGGRFDQYLWEPTVEEVLKRWMWEPSRRRKKRETATRTKPRSRARAKARTRRAA